MDSAAEGRRQLHQPQATERRASGYSLKSSVQAIVLSACFLAVGAPVMFSAIVHSHLADGLVAMLPLVLAVMVLQPKKAVFDARARHFHNERGSRQFDEIYAVQILKERARTRRGRFFSSYELNLVLHDGTRINVTDQDGLEEAREDAQKLVALTGWKLWDVAE